MGVVMHYALCIMAEPVNKYMLHSTDIGQISSSRLQEKNVLAKVIQYEGLL